MAMAIGMAAKTAIFKNNLESLKLSSNFEYLAIANVVFSTKREYRMLKAPSPLTATFNQFKEMFNDTYRILVALRVKEEETGEAETETEGDPSKGKTMFVLLKPPSEDVTVQFSKSPLDVYRVDGTFRSNIGNGCISADSLGITQHGPGTFTLEDQNYHALQGWHKFYQIQIFNDTQDGGYDGVAMQKLLTEMAAFAPPADTSND